MNNKLREFLKLARIENALIAIIVVFVGVKAAGGYIPFFKTLLLALSMFFLNIFANVQNDIVDLESDRANRKGRPLVKGTVSETEATYFAISSLILSLIFALFSGFKVFLVVSLIAILVYFYNTHCKKVVLVSNLTVALVTALVFVVAGVLVHAVRYAIVPALIAFYYNFMREIIKDWADIEGDKSVGITTVPMVLGHKPTTLLILLLTFLFIPFLLIPYVAGVFGRAYLYISVAFCAVPLFASFLMIKKDKEGLKLYSKITKYLMIPLLLAIYLGV